MKMRPTRILYAILSFVFMLMMGAGRLCAQTANTLQHPKDQIALQLGAIQMGYTVPFTLTGNISVPKMQQAVNALVMGRNALDATVAKPAVQVVGALDSPSVDTVEYRDQLYAAVEYVVTSPVVATIKGNATLTGNKKVSVVTKLTVPPNAWTIPVPYALESRSSADVQELANSQNALSSNFTNLQIQTSSFSSNLTTVQGQVNGVSSNVTALSSNVTALQGQTGNLTSNVTALTSAQDDKLAAFEATIQDLRAELVAAGVLTGSGNGGNATADMVSVAGGTLPQSSELAGQTVAAFQIGKYEVTWGEWKTVRDWAVNNGYSDLAGVGDTYPSGSADNFPVINVSWYDVVKWSNARSEKEGLTPVYQVSGTTYKTGQSVPTLNASANGYRLPSEKEWEWAARGGVSSQGYTYSGSNTISGVAWTGENSSGGTKAVGTKAANELGIYDMSGNVWEWCEDAAYGPYRRFRGGNWYHWDYAAVADRGVADPPVNRGNSLGFRLARSSGNMVTVQGGTLPASSGLGNQTVETFQIGKYEVTWGEWKTVRDWAVTNGYSDLAGVGGTDPDGAADNFPVIFMNWYDVLKWCNARSEKEGKTPVYAVNGTTYKTGENVPTVNAMANGYRLPSEKEWEWAARGGVSGVGHNYVYSGSNTASEVAWTKENSNMDGYLQTKAVGTKAANELGMHDMSGNAVEWCWDVYDQSTTYRRFRGGSYSNLAVSAAVGGRDGYILPNRRWDYAGIGFGFRLARSSGN